MDRKRPEAGEVYRHFRGRKYQVLHVAVMTETRDYVVVYEELERAGQEKIYVSRLENFLAPIDKASYPEATQKYRFEKFQETQPAEKPMEEMELILAFLDLERNEDRIGFLMKHREELTDRFLIVAAESLEYTEQVESIEERFAGLIRFLRMKAQYESRRV